MTNAWSWNARRWPRRRSQRRSRRRTPWRNGRRSAPDGWRTSPDGRRSASDGWRSPSYGRRISSNGTRGTHTPTAPARQRLLRLPAAGDRYCGRCCGCVCNAVVLKESGMVKTIPFFCPPKPAGSICSHGTAYFRYVFHRLNTVSAMPARMTAAVRAMT